jgi:hypothetical protein
MISVLMGGAIRAQAAYTGWSERVRQRITDAAPVDDRMVYVICVRAFRDARAIGTGPCSRFGGAVSRTNAGTWGSSERCCCLCRG